MPAPEDSPPASHQDAPHAGPGPAGSRLGQRLLALDRALLLRLRRWEHRWVTGLMRSWTRLGDPELSLLGPAVLWLSFDHGTRYALHFIAGATAGVFASQLLKRLVHRPRPSDQIAGFVALARQPDPFSFPSGHACAAFAAALALAGDGSALFTVMLVVAAGVALSRLYLGLHYPLDVAAGIGLGCVLGWAVSRTFGFFGGG